MKVISTWNNNCPNCGKKLKPKEIESKQCPYCKEEFIFSKGRKISAGLLLLFFFGIFFAIVAKSCSAYKAANQNEISATAITQEEVPQNTAAKAKEDAKQAVVKEADGVEMCRKAVLAMESNPATVDFSSEVKFTGYTKVTFHVIGTFTQNNASSQLTTKQFLCKISLSEDGQHLKGAKILQLQEFQ